MSAKLAESKPRGLIPGVIARLKQRWQEAGWNEFVVLAGIGVFSLAVWVFVELADNAPAGNFLTLETKILRGFRTVEDPAIGIGPSWVPDVARDITALGSGAGLVLLVLLVLGWLTMRGRYRTALFVFIATVGGSALNVALKTAIGRERPHVVPHLVVETTRSFPSGHSMSSAMIYFTLAALLSRSVTRRREKIYLVLSAALLSFLIGVSRVYLGVHYPTDVLAGWAVGTAWALLCLTVAWWLQRRGALGGPREDQ